jgi:hypothetical protein
LLDEEQHFVARLFRPLCLALGHWYILEDVRFLLYHKTLAQYALWFYPVQDRRAVMHVQYPLTRQVANKKRGIGMEAPSVQAGTSPSLTHFWFSKVAAMYKNSFFCFFAAIGLVCKGKNHAEHNLFGTVGGQWSGARSLKTLSVSKCTITQSYRRLSLQ